MYSQFMMDGQKNIKFKMSVCEISYSNEMKLFDGDSIILYLTYFAVIIEVAREARGSV